MEQTYYQGNRARFCEAMEPNSMAVIFAGKEIRKTNDEYYPFFTDRNFLYLTGLDSKEFILMMGKDAQGQVTERVYILAPDLMAERWTGRRLKSAEVRETSGITDVRYVDRFEGEFHSLACSGLVKSVYLDLYRVSPEDMDRPAHHFLRRLQKESPYLSVVNADTILRRLRLIKQPCEIAALRRAEEITREGILAMMKASHPGMYEYQYKAEYDRALGQYGPQGPGFPSIISAGENNFCIHYYAYKGQAQDGDMVLNDVDATIRRYNAERLVEAGVMASVDEIGTYMWHGGAHHIGYDVHDVVETPEILAPGMVFCVDVGIYHEEWGIGFRLEDNCLVTEDGCENLSAGIPRTVEEIETVMAGK